VPLLSLKSKPGDDSTNWVQICPIPTLACGGDAQKAMGILISIAERYARMELDVRDLYRARDDDMRELGFEPPRRRVAAKRPSPSSDVDRDAKRDRGALEPKVKEEKDDGSSDGAPLAPALRKKPAARVKATPVKRAPQQQCESVAAPSPAVAPACAPACAGDQTAQSQPSAEDTAVPRGSRLDDDMPPECVLAVLGC